MWYIIVDDGKERGIKMDFESKTDEFLPWNIKNRKTEEQLELQRYYTEKEQCVFGENCFVSKLANICDSTICMGDDNVICANALIRHADITMGKNCSVNSDTVLQGKITMGDNVRIAPKVSIIAHNHGYEDIFTPITCQPCSGKGIQIGSDVWIGANVVVVDGVKIGSHSIIGAGSVVTRDVGDYVIVAGNPARVLKNRIEVFFQEKLEKFVQKVEDEIEDTVASYISDGDYVDTRKTESPKRAWCDAVEILAMFGKKSTLFEERELIQKLQNMQVDAVNYETLSIGYALEVLGSHVLNPYTSANIYRGKELIKTLESYDWKQKAWGCGNDIDCLGTAFYQNEKHFGMHGDLETLFAWLNAHVNAETGLWGTSNMHESINGFYRLTRGTYAQFNQPLPMCEKTIDSILKHAQNPELFSGKGGTSCDVLDVIHPLWLCKKQTNYRYAEGREWALRWIEKVITHWEPGKGFRFELLQDTRPSLMGTEMWLSILYLLCDYVGIAHLLTYEPKGVHRLVTEI